MRTKTEIVILNWNGAGHLRRFLPSVLASVPEGVGVVVADNGSTDDSLGVLEREFPAVGRIVLDRNYGFAGGYNRALEYLDADYFILLNSDVETPAGWVEPLVETLDRDRTVAAVAPKLLSLVEPARFEYAGASGGFIDYLGYPFCRGRILQCVERDEGQYDDARDVFGRAALLSAAGPKYFGHWAVSTRIFSPTWRRSTFAGGCNWPVTGCGSSPGAGFITSAGESGAGIAFEGVLQPSQ